jgi:hypothetical protein
MIVDKLARFSNAQALTANAASTDLMDLGDADRNLGIGSDLYLVSVVTTALTDAGSNSTVTVTLETDTLAAFGSATKVQECFIIPALAAVGDTFTAKVSRFQTPEQFLRVFYTMTNGDLTTGSVTTFLTSDAQEWRAPSKGYEIDQ